MRSLLRQLLYAAAGLALGALSIRLMLWVAVTLSGSWGISLGGFLGKNLGRDGAHVAILVFVHLWHAAIAILVGLLLTIPFALWARSSWVFLACALYFGAVAVFLVEGWGFGMPRPEITWIVMNITGDFLWAYVATSAFILWSGQRRRQLRAGV